MSDSDTIYSDDSERSEDSDSGESLADFVVDDDEEPETCPACHAEICASNIIVNRKRQRTPVDHEEESDDEEESDSSSDYVPSEGDCSSSDGSDSCDESD